jgi:hypothetical protein
VWHINLGLYTLVELWAWSRSEHELIHREDSPWEATKAADRSGRKKAEGGSHLNPRPSHADRRKTLQAECLEREFSRRVPQQQMKQKFQTLLSRLLRITLAG